MEKNNDLMNMRREILNSVFDRLIEAKRRKQELDEMKAKHTSIAVILLILCLPIFFIF